MIFWVQRNHITLLGVTQMSKNQEFQYHNWNNRRFPFLALFHVENLKMHQNRKRLHVPKYMCYNIMLWDCWIIHHSKKIKKHHIYSFGSALYTFKKQLWNHFILSLTVSYFTFFDHPCCLFTVKHFVLTLLEFCNSSYSAWWAMENDLCKYSDAKCFCVLLNNDGIFILSSVVFVLFLLAHYVYIVFVAVVLDFSKEISKATPSTN